MDAADTDWLLAERAAELLLRNATANDEERAADLHWLTESPLHVREALAATVTDLVLTHLFRNGGIDPEAFAKPTTNVHDIANDTGTPSRLDTRPSAHFSCLARLKSRLTTSRTTALFVAITSLIALFAMIAFAIQSIAAHGSIVTGPGEWRTKMLSDGTMLLAGPRTQVSVEFTDEQRIVRMVRGEALLDVAKDPRRPFFVATELATARAVGTAFAVSHESPQQLDITVKEGVVAVTRRSRARPHHPDLSNASESVELTAGQQVSVRKTNTLATRQVHIAAALAWASGELIFDDETVEQAAHAFNRRNERQIEIACPRLATRAVRGTFSATDPDSFVAQLKQLGAVVEETEGTLIVSVSGKR